MPNTIVIQPIVSIFLNWFIRLNLIKRYPTIITGNDEIIILKSSSLFLTKSKISFLKYTNTAKNDPICRLTSIDKFWFSKIKKLDTKIRWEDELTGRNSVIPWTTDKINTSITLII